MWRKRTNWTLNWRGVLPFGSMNGPRKYSLMLLDTHYTQAISLSPSIIGEQRRGWLGVGTIHNPRKKEEKFFFNHQCPFSFHLESGKQRETWQRCLLGAQDNSRNITTVISFAAKLPIIHEPLLKLTSEHFIWHPHGAARGGSPAIRRCIFQRYYLTISFIKSSIIHELSCLYLGPRRSPFNIKQDRLQMQAKCLRLYWRC